MVTANSKLSGYAYVKLQKIPNTIASLYGTDSLKIAEKSGSISVQRCTTKNKSTLFQEPKFRHESFWPLGRHHYQDIHTVSAVIFEALSAQTRGPQNDSFLLKCVCSAVPIAFIIFPCSVPESGHRRLELRRNADIGT